MSFVNNAFRWQALGLALFVSAWGYGTPSARGEGSANLTDPATASGGDRPFLDYRPDFTGSTPRRTRIRVYANPGETINLGSSANGIGEGQIQYTDPSGNTATCPITPTTGRIQNRTQELAGPFPTQGGYVPCTVTVEPSQGGIWEVTFVSPNPDGTVDPDPISATAPWPQQNEDDSFVTAWDVTVTRGGTAIPGRAYANYLPLNLGANQLSLSSQAFFLTEEGYQYRIDLNGIDPFGFIFFANNKGFQAQGNPIYSSISLQPPTPGVSVYDPTQPDAGTDVTHKLFFQRPNPDLPLTAPISPASGGSTWLFRPEPLPPPVPNNFAFTGTEGTANQAGTTDPRGGVFTFDSPGRGSYRIIIDVNQNNRFGDGNDRILLGIANAGANRIRWDGLDANRNTIPASNVPYGAQIRLSNGEVHFPIFDPENNPRGLIIERLNEPANLPTTPTPPRFNIFYNDAPVDGPGAPTPLTAVGEGVDSSNGAHGFTTNFGDRKGIDTWTYYPSSLTSLAAGISVKAADLQIQKRRTTDGPVVAGGPISYIVTVTNNGPSNVTGAQVTDTLPEGVSGATWTCAITTGTGACGATSGRGNINTTVNLDSGATATYTITGAIAPTATGTLLPNTATVTRPSDVTDPDPNNNTAESDSPPIQPNPVQPIGSKSVRLVTDADNSGSVSTGDTLEYTITYINTSPSPVTNFLATDTIDSARLRLESGSYRFTASGAGTTVTGNPEFNGATNPNLTNPTSLGILGANGGQVVINYRAVILAGAGERISNQARATSTGGTVNPSLTDAVENPGDLPQEIDDGINQGNLPGTGDDDPSIVTVAGSGQARVRLIKRVTSVTRSGVPISGLNFNSFVDTDSPDDNRDIWSQFLPLGVPSIGPEAPLQSGDEVEYTIYFLSDGTGAANGIRFCDAIPTQTNFLPDAFGSASGITVNRAGAVAPQTNSADSDAGTFFSPLAPLPAGNSCPNQTNSDGAVLVNLGNISNVAGSNYGFVRFRVKIN